MRETWLHQSFYTGLHRHGIGNTHFRFLLGSDLDEAFRKPQVKKRTRSHTDVKFQ